ncbi:OLC1v1019450C1 [Oldenlandia corymbosa var. corymbosa]|uniref:Transmembrane 9 superfamily member n=1 Tax=Oldenlandia corymbosa var. corymbosa TaxID=529605 RepID=A0AAV1EE42_OLDCO|nr:OLC1v1019450C1 [Oldenlandia corymbosa var. corymbosa]
MHSVLVNITTLLFLSIGIKNDLLSVKVNKLSSTKTQLPYHYYFLQYCKPKKILNSAENLGEVLRGDWIENSVYEFHMRQETPCKVACKVKLNAEAAKNFKEKIGDEYRVNMILDNLSVAVIRQRRDGSQSTAYEYGFRVGFKGNYAGLSCILQKAPLRYLLLIYVTFVTLLYFVRAKRRSILSITT